MNIKRAKDEIKNTIEAYLLKDEYGEYVIPPIRQRPVLLLGAPGIGKTQIMEQIARECGVGLVAYTITHHTRQSAIGLPFISRQKFGGEEYAVTEYTMSEIVASVYEKMEQTGLKEGILFIDEINCVSETLAPAMLQFLQCKTFGSHAIPGGWIIVAAGNPPEYNKSVREFDVVTMDRVKKIEVEPDFEVWKEYALKQNIHPAVISYLNARPRSFYRMETTVEGRSFATPRGWEDLSRLLEVYERIHKKADRDVIVQYIQHEKIAKDFANYLELYEKYRMDYQIEAVLQGQIDELLVKRAAHASFDEKLSVISLFLSKCTVQFYQVFRLEEKMRLLFEKLTLLKKGLLGVRRNQAQAYMDEIVKDLQQEYTGKKQAELLDREDDRIYRQALEVLENYAVKLKKSGIQDGEKAFAAVKDWFSEEEEVLDREFETSADMLEHVFDFMEAVFGAGQEMVVFITELNSNYYSIRFLQEYECERYYEYNRNLLFEEKRRGIEARLKELENSL